MMQKEGFPVFQNPSNNEIKDILTSAKTIAVVGLSDNPLRESYAIASEMQKHGYKIVPVNPNVTEVLGEKAYASVTAIPHPVDIINIFRKSEALPAVVQDAVQTSAPVIWAQQGVYNEEAAEIAQSAGKTMVMDRCIKVMHSLFANA
jgi:uncharacterized protein